MLAQSQEWTWILIWEFYIRLKHFGNFMSIKEYLYGVIWKCIVWFDNVWYTRYCMAVYTLPPNNFDEGPGLLVILR